jgi:AcrR family transcriptional regulator
MKESAVRTRILDVASRLFYDQGYNSTGINQIIAEADIARASLYHHFPSKTDLLKAYIQQADDQWFIGLEAFLKPIADPREKLLGIFDYRMGRQQASHFGGCQFVKVSAEIPREESELFELVSHQKQRIQFYIKGLLLQIKTNQRYEAILSTDMLAQTLFLLMEGATVTSSIFKDPDALKSAKEIAEKLI